MAVLAVGLPLAAADEEESDPWYVGEELLLADGEGEPEVWEAYPDMEYPAIERPASNACFVPGAEVACEAVNPGDWDTLLDPWGEYQDDVTVDWGTTGGTWKNDNNQGENVTWVAPQQPGQYGIYAYSHDASGVPYVPERNDDDQSAGVTVYVVGVQKLEYSADAGGTWMDVPNPLSVPKGAEVRFRAIRTGGYAWPEGKPVWGGNAGAQGVSESVTVTFNTLSTTANDFKTVTVECGNTVTANVVVCELAALKYRIGEGDWDDVPAVLYVPVETVVQYEAVITPTGAPWPVWPIAKPVWTGYAQSTGGGTAEWWYYQTSWYPTHYFPVSAECSTTFSTNVLVYEVAVDPMANFLLVNSDDDDDNGVADLDDDGSAEEDDLVQFLVHLVPYQLDAEVELIDPGQRVRVWTSPTKGEGNRILFEGGDNIFTTPDFPVALYLEGISPSTMPADLVLRIECSKGTTTATHQAELTVGAIDFVDTNLDETISLRVAKWQGSYDQNGDLLDNFIDAGPDPDRFFVRLIAPNLNTNPTTSEWQGLYIGTQSPIAAYDDDMTIIQLRETFADSGVFVSESQILVGDAVDDAGRGQHGIPTTAWLHPQDDQDQIPFGNGDRTHRIALGGVVNAAVQVEGNIWTYYNRVRVPRVKVIRRMKIYILKVMVDGQMEPVREMDDVLDDIAWANERLAQVGVFIEIDPQNIVPQNPPTGVELDTTGFADFLQPGNLTDEEKDLFDGLGTEDLDDIVAFYVNYLANTPQGGGEAIAPAAFPGENDIRLNNVVIAADHQNHLTPVHEIGHVLLNAPNVGEQRNVMFGPRTSETDVTLKRRWNEAQETAIHGSAFVEEPQ